MGITALRIGYARGVTPGKWARVWAERHPRLPLDLVMTDAVDAMSTLLDGTVAMGFVRVPAGGVPETLHTIALYREQPYAVAAKDGPLDAADAVTLAEVAALADELGGLRHPFDDDIEAALQVAAAGVGIAVVPQSIARLFARKDLAAKPVTDADGWQVALAWPREQASELAGPVQDFIGVVRGRTANSSRGAAEQAPEAPKEKPKRAPRAGATRSTPKRGQAPRGGRSRRRPTR